MNRVLCYSDFMTVPLALVAICLLRLPHVHGLAAYLLAFAAGATAWTFIEYWVHRALHMRSFPGLKALHGLTRAGHMRHHQKPAEAPGGTLYSTAIILAFFLTAVWAPTVVPELLGFLVGYLVFITLHHAEHHAVELRGPIIRRLAENHALHHSAGPGRMFGVSCSVWDRVFGTA